MQKINFNKSIKDKEKKILEYYKKKSNLDKTILEKPVIRKRTKKHIPKQSPPHPETDDKKHDTEKLTKLNNFAKLPINEPSKPKIVEMD